MTHRYVITSFLNQHSHQISEDRKAVFLPPSFLPVVISTRLSDARPTNRIRIFRRHRDMTKAAKIALLISQIFHKLQCCVHFMDLKFFPFWHFYFLLDDCPIHYKHLVSLLLLFSLTLERVKGIEHLLQVFEYICSSFERGQLCDVVDEEGFESSRAAHGSSVTVSWVSQFPHRSRNVEVDRVVFTPSLCRMKTY